MAHNYCKCWGNKGSCIDCAEEEIDRLTAQLAEARASSEAWQENCHMTECGLEKERNKHASTIGKLADANRGAERNAKINRALADKLAERDAEIEKLSKLKLIETKTSVINGMWCSKMVEENAVLREEVERLKQNIVDTLTERLSDVDTARKQVAQEIVEMMGGWPLSNSTLAQCRQSIRQRYGLEG